MAKENLPLQETERGSVVISNASGGSVQASWVGMVHKKTLFEGTLSEYSFFLLVLDDKSQYILFNEKKKSIGLEKYVNKKVHITGTLGSGEIGWRHTTTNGIIIENIEIVP
jgi:hypothetical protein